jgi:hypothetical protein
VPRKLVQYDITRLVTKRIIDRLETFTVNKDQPKGGGQAQTS